MLVMVNGVQLILYLYLLLTMQSDDKPMSIKDRIAKFQGIINNSPSPSPTLKPAPPKQSPPPQVTTPSISPPASNPSSKQQGQVQSPSIVKPSAAKQNWQLNLQQAQNDPPKKTIDAPVPKAPEPKKVVEIESPEVVKPSVARQTWQPQSHQSNKNDNFLKILESANKQSQSPVQTAKQGIPQVNKPAEKIGNGEQKSLTQAAIRQMLEGKMASMNRQSVPVYPKTVIPKPQKPQSQNVVNEAPKITTNAEVGTVKGNTQKLNQFFEAQKEQQKIKEEEEKKKKAENNELKPEGISPVKKQEENRPISQNNYVLSQPSLSPGLGLASPGLTQHTSLPPGDSSELGLMARLKRKKKTKEVFSSDSD